MSDELPPHILRSLLREHLENKQNWENSMMQQFRKQFLEPMNDDLNLIADELISTNTILDAVAVLFSSIQNF